MLSVEIIKRSFLAIKNNLDVAWKVSGFWWILLTIMTLPLAIQLRVTNYRLGDETTISYAESLGSAILLYALFYFGFVIVGFGIIAIGWHRFLIYGECPNKLLFVEKGWRWGQYFWAGFLLALIATIVMIVPSVFYYASPENQGDASIGFSAIGYNLFIQIAATIPFTYLGLTLPAIAIDTQKTPTRRITFLESWQLTKKYGKELFMMVLMVSIGYAIITSFCEQVLGAGTISAFDPVQIAGYLVGTITSWAMTLFSIGLLSELYKEIVPDRWRHKGQPASERSVS